LKPYVLGDLKFKAAPAPPGGASDEEPAMLPNSTAETPALARLRVLGATGLALALLLGAHAALAQGAPPTACASHETMSAQLAQRFAEVPVALGLTGGGRMVVQLFASADGATWTVVLTSPDGKSCIAAAGRDWQSLPAKPLDPEA
jgi:hypothetical protein